MKEIVARVTSKGQVTIPVEIRRELHLSPGDRLAFVLNDKGTVELRPAADQHIVPRANTPSMPHERMDRYQLREVAREEQFEATQSEI